MSHSDKTKDHLVFYFFQIDNLSVFILIIKGADIFKNLCEIVKNFPIYLILVYTIFIFV